MYTYLEFGLLFLIGAPLVVYGWVCWRKVLVARRFPYIEAIIVESRIADIEIDIGETSAKGFQPKITFTAWVNGHKVISDVLCPDASAYRFFNYQHASAFARRYPVGTLVQARQSNVLTTDLLLLSEVDWDRKSHYLGIAGLGIFVWLAMCGLMWLKV